VYITLGVTQAILGLGTVRVTPGVMYILGYTEQPAKLVRSVPRIFVEAPPKWCPANSGSNDKAQIATTQQPQISCTHRKINTKMIILYYHLNHKDKEVIHFFRSISAPFSSFRIA